MADDSFFQEIAHVSLDWREYKVHVPIFYSDLSFMNATFLVPTRKVQDLLPSPRLKPYRVTPWHTVLSITAYEYRECDLGPYNEVGIGFPVTIDKPTPLFTGILRKLPETAFTYTHHLPVTTEFARVLGFEFAGYPKFIAEIEFEDQKEWRVCTLKENGRLILRLAGRKLPLTKMNRFRVCPITFRNGYLLRSELVGSESKGGFSKGGGDVQLELGNHPIAEELRSMDIGKSSGYSFSPQTQFVLTPVFESYKGE